MSEEEFFLIRQVGQQYEDKKWKFSYSNVKFDEDGWADASRFLPAILDLCYCMIEGRSKKIPGWYTGTSLIWDGLNIKPTDKILFWKRNFEYGNKYDE